MSKAKKNKREDAAPALNEAEQRHLLGLYSAYAAAPDPSAPAPFWAKLDLAVYAPIGIVLWIFIYIITGFGITPFSHNILLGLGLLISLPALLGAVALFRPQWPANRTAAMALGLMVLDFWVWFWGRPFEGGVAKIYLLIDIGFFSAILFFVYMFVFRRLHVEAVVRALTLKAFFDFAAYVLSGGFGVAVLSNFGIIHPLHLDALFTVAMLELWALLVYLLKYRGKIFQLI